MLRTEVHDVSSGRRRTCVPTGLGAFLLTALWTALALGQGPQAGQDAERGPAARRPSVVADHPDSALAQVIERLAGAPLELEEAVRLALQNGTSVGEAEAALRAAEAALRRERGAFDPELFASVERSSDDQPTTSPFAGADVLQEDAIATRAGIRTRLRFGTEIEAALESNRLETNSTFAAVNPEYRSSGRIDVRQPLLKGFGPAARDDLTAAEEGVRAATAGVIDTRLGARAAVEGLYWQLYASERDLAVQRLIVEQARVFLEEVETRSTAGLVGPNQVANARVFLAEQELAEIDREEQLDAVSDALAVLMGAPPEGRAVRYHPVTAPLRAVDVPPLATLVERALARNGELAAARAELAARRATARGARWDALPALDLVGSLGGSGLSGRGQEVSFGDQTFRADVEDGVGPSLSQVFDGDFPAWSIGLEVSVPIGLRDGRGERDRLRAEVERAEQRLEALRRDIEESVRAAHREAAHGARRLAIAERGVDAAYEQVRIGLIEFENGRSTAFELVRLGADLAAAQQRLSAALVRMARADAELRRLTADAIDTIGLDAAGIDVEHTLDDQDDLEVRP
ncbi:MAG: TolC family protein [Candidatus Eiseniibacteriota bacterium]|jgi:outer membrane protein TolC